MGFAIIGKKVVMTSIFDKYVSKPVTVVQVNSNIIAKKVELDDGRKALVLGFGKKKNVTKPEKGQFKKIEYVPERLLQIIVDEETFDKYNVGDLLSKEVILSLLGQEISNKEQESSETDNKDQKKDEEPKKNPLIDVTGISKGKGFAGVIKRWGFHRQPKTHGQSDRERHPGSIGAQTPGRVLKGKKMPGRMGHDKVTVKNLEVVDIIEKDNNLYMLIKGAVPGPKNGYIVIKFK